MEIENIYNILNKIATNQHNLKRYCRVIHIFIKRKISDNGSQKHHIIPRCILQDLCMDDFPENIVKLTPKQHKFVHKILTRAFPRHRLSSASNFPYASGFIAVYDNNVESTIRVPIEDYYNDIVDRFIHPAKGFINLIHIESGEKIRVLSEEKGYYENLGYQHPNKGKKKPEGFSEKLRMANLGKKHSDTTKEKLRIANTGKKVSEDALKNMSIAQKGKSIGRVASIETRLKQSITQTGKILSKFTRDKMSETRKTMKWINDSVINKRVQYESLQEWIDKGFVLGRI